MAYWADKAQRRASFVRRFADSGPLRVWGLIRTCAGCGRCTRRFVSPERWDFPTSDSLFLIKIYIESFLCLERRCYHATCLCDLKILSRL